MNGRTIALLTATGLLTVGAVTLAQAPPATEPLPPPPPPNGAAAPIAPAAPPAPTQAAPPPPAQPAQPAAAPPPPNSTSPGSAPAAPTAPAPAPAPAPTGASLSPEGGIAELEGFLEPFIYDIVNRRDPFQPWAEFVPTEDSGGGSSRALSPAQRWDLEKMKLIGIMWDIRDPKAMFLDPDQDVMILGRDESIGNKNGYIAAIREGEVVVVEAIRKRGDLVYRTRILRIER